MVFAFLLNNNDWAAMWFGGQTVLPGVPPSGLLNPIVLLGGSPLAQKPRKVSEAATGPRDFTTVGLFSDQKTRSIRSPSAKADGIRHDDYTGQREDAV